MENTCKSFEIDEAFQRKLYKLTKEFEIVSIHYHPETSDAMAQIVIITRQNKEVEVLESRKWIRKTMREQPVMFHVLDVQTITHLFKIGNLFVACYCNRESIIYRSPEWFNNVMVDWRLYKTNFLNYENQFHHDREILISEINKYKNALKFTSIFLIYESLYTHHVSFLESLYLGKTYMCCTLHQRITQLSHVIPSIASLFIKENEVHYFLILEIEKAKKATYYDDAVDINDDLIGTTGHIEQNLYELVCVRFMDLKTLKESDSRPYLNLNIVPQKEESELSQIISKIVSKNPLEEIYLFDKSEHRNGTVYYFLLVGSGLGTGLLYQIQQSIQASFNNKTSVLLIGHSRIWIQKSLYVHQNFFQQIMTAENRVYQSHEFHPMIHWEDILGNYYPDLDFEYRRIKRRMENYFVLRTNIQNENYSGLWDLFSNIVIRIFHTTIYGSLSYQANYLRAEILWELCLYGAPDLRNIEFLFEKICSEEFFKLLNLQYNFRWDVSYVSESKLLVMDEILQVLFDKLTDIVKKVNERYIE